ncbi:MAG: hypothetical protein H7199_00355 [Burkholderiales bacterium]|nr:hypothetical protein [Flavobacterium sp.]
MFLLLVTATTIYLIKGDYGDRVFLAVRIVLVLAISLYQEAGMLLIL